MPQYVFISSCLCLQFRTSAQHPSPSGPVERKSSRGLECIRRANRGEYYRQRFAADDLVKVLIDAHFFPTSSSLSTTIHSLMQVIPVRRDLVGRSFASVPVISQRSSCPDDATILLTTTARVGRVKPVVRLHGQCSRVIRIGE